MSQRRFLLAILLAVGVIGSATPLTQAQSVTETFWIDTDAQIDSRDPTTNFGNSSTAKVVVNGDDGSLVRTLLAIPSDVWSIPPEQIDSATLHFYTWQDSTGDRTVNLHPLTTGFVESGATWETYDGVQAWTSAGGDYDPGTFVTALEGTNWFTWDLSPLWDNSGFRTFGALLKMDDESDPGAGQMPRAPFTSSNGAASERPYVEITHTVPEPGSLALLLGLTGLSWLRRGRR